MRLLHALLLVLASLGASTLVVLALARLDLLLVGLTLAFFLLAWLYVRACERV